MCQVDPAAMALSAAQYTNPISLVYVDHSKYMYTYTQSIVDTDEFLM